jgi:hypothetical protein
MNIRTSSNMMIATMIVAVVVNPEFINTNLRQNGSLD